MARITDTLSLVDGFVLDGGTPSAVEAERIRTWLDKKCGMRKGWAKVLDRGVIVKPKGMKRTLEKQRLFTQRYGINPKRCGVCNQPAGAYHGVACSLTEVAHYPYQEQANCCDGQSVHKVRCEVAARLNDLPLSKTTDDVRAAYGPPKFTKEHIGARVVINPHGTLFGDKRYGLLESFDAEPGRVRVYIKDDGIAAVEETHMVLDEEHVELSNDWACCMCYEGSNGKVHAHDCPVHIAGLCSERLAQKDEMFVPLKDGGRILNNLPGGFPMIPVSEQAHEYFVGRQVCEECYDTGFYHGIGAPCAKGCKP